MSELHQGIYLPWGNPTAQVPIPSVLRTANAELPESFTVRMATAEDLAFVAEANDRRANLQALVETLATSETSEKAEVLRAAAGLDGQPTATFIRQVEFVLRCTADPKLDRELVLWLSRTFPLFFSALFQKIMELTGEGAQLGK